VNGKKSIWYNEYMKAKYFVWKSFLIVLVFCPVFVSAATLSLEDVIKDFEKVYGRKPTNTELNYWKGRRSDKKDNQAMLGAMYYDKAKKAQPSSSKSTGTSIVSMVPDAFKQVFNRAPNKEEKAWWVARASCGNFKKYNDMLVSMKYHKANNVTKGTGGKEQFCAPKTSSTSTKVSVNSGLGISGNAKGPIVKIGIWLSKKTVDVTSEGQFAIQTSEGKKVFKAGSVIKVSYSNGRYFARGTNFKGDYDGPVKFIPIGGSILKVANYSDVGASGTNYNRFRGNIIVQRNSENNGLWAINELRAEEYVKGLAETSDNAPEAFRRALAVAARTYVLNHNTLGGRQPHNGFDITNTPNDQWYRGYNYELLIPGFAAAVKTTVGQVLTYEGKLIASLYFSGSDGRTRSAKEVWHTSKFPYLSGKPDPYGGKTLRGHGVGMSGDGAVNYARKEGWDYKKILNYYYTGIKLERGY